jgi:hypothetical protein
LATNIYIDAIMGSDETGDGTAQKPYKTLQYFCLNKAVRNNADYTIHLKKGTYEITNGTIFGVFASGNITIIGKDRDTEILQKAGMYSNSNGGGSINFTLTIAKLKYNIDRSLTAANLNDYKWNWNFYNVLIEYMPDNAYSVIYPIASKTVFRNCVKLTNSNAMLRTTEGTIEVYDSMGYFTNGYSTNRANWDKGGNVIGSVSDYEEVLRKGLYSWNINRTFILHNGTYKRYIEGRDATMGTNLIPIMTADTSPSPYVSSASSYYSTYSPFYAFNRVFNGSSRWIANATAPQWIGIDLATPQKAFNYQLASGAISQQINSWVLRGSNDNVNWIDLDTVVNHPLPIDTYETFTINTPNDYRYYRLNVTSTANNALPSLSGFTLLTESSPAVEAQWDNVSNNLPSSTQFTEKGMGSLSSMFTRTITELKPTPMSDKTDILSGEEGKVFSKNIDLKKYFDLRKITVKEVD